VISLTEANSPIDINHELVEKYHKEVEETLVTYDFGNKRHSLPELMNKIDKKEPYVMSDIERDSYLAIREGMQVFRATAQLVGEKVGLKEKLVNLGSKDPELLKLKDFCYSYATFVASKYVVKKLDMIVAANNDGGIPTPEMDLAALKLNNTSAESLAMRHLLAPVYKSLLDHLDDKDAEYGHPVQFAMEMREVFTQYAKLAAEKEDQYPDLDRHVKNYQFRVLDDFIELNGFEDKSIPVAKKQQAAKLTFQPISPNEIVGNKMAKRKIARYMDRIALYNATQQNNPILDLGGLSWTNLFDGPPGTGKSSMFRMAMTILQKRAEQIGLPYNVVMVDQSIKDEFYGKTGKILLNRLEVTNDPKALSVVVFDDIDLLTSKRDDAQGADNDVNNIIMQYLDGVFTVRRGNVINFAATNKPTGLDDAMRNRFNDRLLIDGPITKEDFADLLVLRLGKLQKSGLVTMDIGYKPFQTQDQMDEHGHWSGGKVAEYMAEEFEKRKDSTFFNVGEFFADLKKKNPKISGRSANAIIEAIKERSADFDIPDDWFENRAAFIEQPYDTQRAMLKDLYVKIDGSIFFQEAKRYFDSEERYAENEAKSAVERNYNAHAWDVQARIQVLRDQIVGGDKSNMAELAGLEAQMEAIQQDRIKTVREVEKHAKEEKRR
jgi:AAA+ superfamily predicted ATPase